MIIGEQMSMNVISYSTKILINGRAGIKKKRVEVTCSECQCLYEVNLEQKLPEKEEFITFGTYIKCPQCGSDNYLNE